MNNIAQGGACKPLTDKELAAYEAERDLAAELLQAVQEMKAGQQEEIRRFRGKLSWQGDLDAMRTDK